MGNKSGFLKALSKNIKTKYAFAQACGLSDYPKFLQVFSLGFGGAP